MQAEIESRRALCNDSDSHLKIEGGRATSVAGRPCRIGIGVSVNAPESIEPKLSSGVATRYAGASAGPARPLAEAELAARRQRSRRATFIKWLRKVHGWVGLWGAVLGLMFGVTGFVMNHRAPPLKISPGAPRVSEVQMPLPVPAPKSPARLEAWLIKELKFDAGRTRIRKEAAQPVEWGDRSVMQPEHWQITLFKPGANVVADYWVGSQAISLKRSDNSLMTTLTNLHRGVGMNIFWVLLMDTIAGSMILLSLTGVLLWTELNKRRTIGVVLVAGSITAALLAGLS